MIKRITFIFIAILCVTLSKAIASDVASDTVYVIQVKTHSNVRVIESAKKSLMAKYPDKKLLTQFRSPQYTLSIGYFATEEEAQKVKNELEKEYPGCVILPIEKKQ